MVRLRGTTCLCREATPHHNTADHGRLHAPGCGETMNDLPRQKLCELIAEHGPDLCQDARRCKALLKEACGAHKQEIRVLTEVLTEGALLDELRAAPPDAAR